METILALDRNLFLLINASFHTPFFNTLALFLSGVGKLGIIWFVLGVFLFIREERKDKWFFAPIIAAGVSSWVLIEGILKPLVGRLRPAVEMGAIIIGNISDSFSFPSGHATIAFAMAVVLSKKEPQWSRYFYVLAILIAISRIYLGFHYPLDVLIGSFLGWSIGKIAIMRT